MTDSQPSSAARAIDAWEHFCFERIPPHAYALLRIGLGLFGLAILLSRTEFAALWDVTGFVAEHRGWIFLKSWMLAHDSFLLAGRVFFVASVAVFALMTVGLWSRVTVPLAFCSTVLQYNWNNLPMSGADDVLRALLFCLMWADTGSVWSLDAWRTERNGVLSSALARDQWPVITPLRMIQVQISLVYLAAGLYKLQSTGWRDGSAVHYVLNSNIFRRFPELATMPGVEGFVPFATYATLLWELGFAFLVLFKKTRALALISGAMIHFGMFTMMEVGPFHSIMVIGYIAFLDPHRIPGVKFLPKTLDNRRRIDHISIGPTPGPRNIAAPTDL